MLGHVTTLRDPLVQVLGKKASDTFEKVFGLRTVGDLLRHYPRRYYTRGELTPLDSLTEGDHVTVLARVAMSSVAGAGGLRLPGHAATGTARGAGTRRPERLEVIVTDGTGKLQLTFFAGRRVSREAAAAGRARPVRGHGVKPSAAAASWYTPSTSCSRPRPPTSG